MFLRLLFVFSKFHPELRDNWNRKLNTRIDPMPGNSFRHKCCLLGLHQVRAQMKSIHQRQGTGESRMPYSEVPLYILSFH
jgi:hypothetical protein